jgi:polar amino acid transport system substrate-binding protein
MDNKLKVVVTQNSPFIVESNGKYSGFEIELWEAIAKEIGVTFEYEKHHFQELIPLIAEKKADVAFSAITITEKREEIVDFSHSTFKSGLHILLSKNRSKIDFGGTIRSFLTQGYKQLIKPLFVLLLIILLFGNALWFIERGSGTTPLSYFPGVFQSIWVSLCVIIGSPDALLTFEVRSWAGKFILTLGQLVNLAVLGLVVGELTAFITTRKIRLNIEGPDDLKGKSVAAVQGTIIIPLLKGFGANVVPVIKIGDAYEKLKRNEVEAVVHDAPVLIYYTLNDGARWAEVAGELFDEQDYGFISQEKGLMREKINRALLTIRENGVYDALYKKWFGETE